MGDHQLRSVSEAARTILLVGGSRDGEWIFDGGEEEIELFSFHRYVRVSLLASKSNIHSLDFHFYMHEDLSLVDAVTRLLVNYRPVRP